MYPVYISRPYADQSLFSLDIVISEPWEGIFGFDGEVGGGSLAFCTWIIGAEGDSIGRGWSIDVHVIFVAIVRHPQIVMGKAIQSTVKHFRSKEDQSTAREQGNGNRI